MGFYLSEVCSPRELRVSLEMVAIAETETDAIRGHFSADLWELEHV
jgi:hypothetical protein